MKEKPINTEDLLRLLEDHKLKLKAPRQNVNDVHKFIEDLDIKDGSCKVRPSMVYKAYVLWGGKKTKTSFSKVFSQYFIPNRSSLDFRYYNLNLRAIQLMNKVDKGLIKI